MTTREPFFQSGPTLGDQYADDRVLQGWIAHTLPEDVRVAVEPELREMGALAGGALFTLQAEDRLAEPRLVAWDAWGRRIDRIELTAGWRRAAEVAARCGVVATAHDSPHGPFARPHQFALAYLFDPSTDTYTCPLAMTDGAARTLLHHRQHTDGALVDRAVAHLTSRDPKEAWTSGQWMTERTGGSDVGLSQTVARPVDMGSVDAGSAEEDAASTFPRGLAAYRLHGTKWFTSAATSQMALTLARVEGSPPGGRGLTLFYLETARPDGTANHLVVNRLKDKLGTRKLPTAELTLDGTLATPVAGIGHGVRNISPMLNITRTWNAVSSVAAMRRGLALARDYARRRVQFGSPLEGKPLHLDTLAGLAAEFEGAFHLAFRCVALLGRVEAGEDPDGHAAETLRLLTPVAKLTTAKQAVAMLSEVLECFGGAGYVEDTGLPRLLRDAQVLPIWEGTTNVLSLDLLRAAGPRGDLGPLRREVELLVSEVQDDDLSALARDAAASLGRAARWLEETGGGGADGRAPLEAGARRLALTVGRSLELALLCRHAQWSRRHGEMRPGHAAARLHAHGIDRMGLGGASREATAALALA